MAKLTFLGSGDAFGSGGRLQTSMLVESGGDSFLIDCGCTVMIGIRKFAVDPNTISTIFISHLHGDHFGGIPFFILDAQLVSKRTAPLAIYGPPGCKERILSAMDTFFPGSAGSAKKFEFTINELQPEESSQAGNISVTCYAVEHPSGSPSLALRIITDGKILAYTGDTNWIDKLSECGKNADIFVAEAYYFDRKVKFHLDLDSLSAHLEDIDPKKLVLTHMSAEMLGRLDNELKGFHCAHDGLAIEF